MNNQSIRGSRLALHSLFALALLGVFVGCRRTSSGPRIAILQDKPQEWADSLRAGFNNGLKESGLIPQKDVTVVIRSADGDARVLATIADSFVKEDYAAIYTLGTQTTQEVFNRSKTKNVIFGAVTDPVAAGFYKDNLQTPLGNITGTQDLWPYAAQFDLIQRLLPSIKRIGILYNASEVNSQVSVSYIRSECKARGIELEERVIASESEVQIATAALVGKNIDLLFIPADNTAQTSSATVIALCSQARVPVFTGISGIVEGGALATVGCNYYELGKVNAEQAVQILKLGKQARELPVQLAKRGDVYINLKSADALGIKVPEDIVKSAFKVFK